MAPLAASEIIAIFEQCLAYVYGERYVRDAPHKTDVATAEKWISAGCTIFIATVVFHERMCMMHERFLHNINASDRSHIPALLSMFEENIYSALRRKGGGGVIDAWEQTESQWRSRVKMFKKDAKYWREEMWGPPPGKPGCRVPPRILKAL